MYAGVDYLQVHLHGAPGICYESGAVTLYDLIADLRREHPTPAATQTLDMVVAELGRSRDNLKSAVAAVSSQPLPQAASPCWTSSSSARGPRASTT